MKTEIVEFNGLVYRRSRSRRYFGRGDGAKYKLHREVWEHFHGPIPPGHDIHHRFNNDEGTTDPQRLECLSRSDHMKLHKTGIPNPKMAETRRGRPHPHTSIPCSAEKKAKLSLARARQTNVSTANAHKAVTGSIWINDGTKRHRIPGNTAIPTGWIKGKGVIIQMSM